MNAASQPGEASGLVVSKLGMVANLFLALIKILTGVLGNSYALIADGIESAAEIFSSVIVWGGLKISVKPPDEEHPYGHGRAETVAAVTVSLMLLAAAILIAVQSIREIRTPQHAPAWFTLVVLVVVVIVKEGLFRYAFAVGRELDSTALRTDAWHHRSDALTSAAAFLGISIALVGGPGFESADDWAALAASGVIAWNGLQLLRDALGDIMDVSASPELVDEVQRIVLRVPGVHSVEKCRIRKLGLHLAMDIHVRVDGKLTVSEGHGIAHRAKDELMTAQHRLRDITIHIEPARSQ